MDNPEKTPPADSKKPQEAQSSKKPRNTPEIEGLDNLEAPSAATDLPSSPETPKAPETEILGDTQAPAIPAAEAPPAPEAPKMPETKLPNDLQPKTPEPPATPSPPAPPPPKSPEAVGLSLPLNSTQQQALQHAAKNGMGVTLNFTPEELAKVNKTLQQNFALPREVSQNQMDGLRQAKIAEIKQQAQQNPELAPILNQAIAILEKPQAELAKQNPPVPLSEEQMKQLAEANKKALQAAPPLSNQQTNTIRQAIQKNLESSHIFARQEMQALNQAIQKNPAIA